MGKVKRVCVLNEAGARWIKQVRLRDSEGAVELQVKFLGKTLSSKAVSFMRVPVATNKM